jgi:hypothetical protein
MTKKTNSLLFRLGINSFWTLKTSNFSNIFNTLRLERGLRNELIKHKWDILCIKWNILEVNIQVYNSFTFSKKTKQKIFRYFKKVKNIRKLSEKFDINSNFLTHFFKKIRVLKFVPTSELNFEIFFTLFDKYQKLKKISKYISHLNLFNWININLILNSTHKLKSNKINFHNNWTLKKKKLRFKLQKINGFLYFKILGISSENIIFFFTHKFIKVNINNIWHNQGWQFKYLVKDKFILKLLFLSCLYNNTKMFSGFIALQLKKNKNHKKILRKITLIIETFWKTRNLNLRGIQLRVTGKLNGSMRKSKYHYSIGKVQLQTFKTFLNYHMSISYTKFGIISTKFWILYGNK